MNILSRKHCIIGESPIWNEFDQKLYQVNGYGANEVCIIDIRTKEITAKKYDFSILAISFDKQGRMIISCKDGAFYLNCDGTREELYDTSEYSIRYGNDAKVGPDGRYYIGTQSRKRMGIDNSIDGKLYSIDKSGKVKVVIDNMILSNGFDWSMDEKRFYHTDSDTEYIKEYLFDKLTGSCEYTGRKIKVDGIDGFTIDIQDNIYAACWGRGHIAVVDTKDMIIKKYIKVPAKVTTSCAFAGENMNNLVVTTATLDTDIIGDSLAGYTFICENDIVGRKPFLFG